MNTDTMVIIGGIIVVLLTIVVLFKFFRAEKEEHPSITQIKAAGPRGEKGAEKEPS